MKCNSTYRASVAPILDLFITLLSMGQIGLKSLIDTREKLLVKLMHGLSEALIEVKYKHTYASTYIYSYIHTYIHTYT